MSSVPLNYKYTKQHEWAKLENNGFSVGITAHAQEALGDVVFVELPRVGTIVEAGKSFGTIESVKAVSDLFAPISGEIIEVNNDLLQNPEKINRDPYGEGWLIKIAASNNQDFDKLLNVEQYSKLL